MGKIIIDGVDVSECEYFKINQGYNCYKGHNCTYKTCFNCYYKQLQRKEKECEELKKLNNILNIAFTSVSNSNIDKIIKQLQNRSEE